MIKMIKRKDQPGGCFCPPEDIALVTALVTARADIP